MKQFNKSKLCALVTTAAVFMSNTAVLPSMNAFAADGDAKTATITITDNWSRTLTYEDIPQAEEKTTTVTLNPNWSGSIDFTGVDTEYGERRYFAENENYNFDFWESYDDIVAAIEANGIDLPEYPTFWLNDITISYNWEFTPADGTTTTDVIINSGAGGSNASGEWTGSDTNEFPFDGNTGSQTVSYSSLTGTEAINELTSMYIDAGAYSKNEGDSFVLNVTSIELDVTYLDGESGGYKGLHDETTDSGNWHMATHDPGASGDRSADIVAAIKAATGDETEQWAIQVTDMTVNYSWEVTTDREEFSFDLNPVVMGNTPAGTETWVEANYWTAYSKDYKTITTKTGSDSFKASTLFADTGITVEDIHCMDINGGMWTDNPADTLTINVTDITLNVTYTIEKPPVEAYVSYNDVQGAEYLSITCDVPTQAECGHENHIADDGTDYWVGQTYCPWPEVSMNKVDTNSNWSDAYYNQWSTNNNVVTPSDDGSSINFMFPMSDIITALGTLSSGEQYVISGNSVNTIKYEILAAKPDMILSTGSYEGGTIEEAMEFDPETNSEVATGIPNITPTFAIAENDNAVSFNGYEAIKIDYTAKSPEACYGVLVVIHGWEDNSTGWMEKFYAIDNSGSIVIDLSSMQDKVFHNIYVGPVAPANSKIGDTFTPGFAVTSAKMVTSYDGSFTSEIAKPVPDEPTIEPETPTTSYTVTTAATENGTVSVDKATAAKGDTVTITVKPADGYEVDTITVTGASGDVTVTDNAFTMPDEEVTITVTFKAIVVAPTPTPTPTPTPSTPSAPSTTTPETTEKAEEVVEEAIEEAKENSTVKIKIKTEDTKIKAEVFLEAKDKDVTLEITLDNGVTWKIESDSISEDAADVDIDVKIKTKNVPSKKVEEIAEGNETMQLSLAHNGEFGFKASLDIPVEKKHNGKVANLFHYKNNGEFEFMASVKVKNGKATLPFTHASEYVVVFADEAMGEDVSSAAEIYSDSNTILDADSNSADVKVYVITLAVLAFAGFAVARKIRQN